MKKRRKHIFLVSKVGPEWSEPVEAFGDHKVANTKADELNAKPKRGVIDELSSYVVLKVPYHEI